MNSICDPRVSFQNHAQPVQDGSPTLLRPEASDFSSQISAGPDTGERVIHLFEPVTPALANRVILELLQYEAAGSALPVHMFLYSPGGCVVSGLATQGISAIRSVLGSDGMLDHLLNNCRTKFFFANDCPDTLKYFETLGGTADRQVTNVQYRSVTAPPRFRLPNHTFATPKATVEVGHTVDTRKEPKFVSAELGALPNGTALVVLKGRKIARYTMGDLYASC